MKNTILNPAHILGKICCPLPIILVHSKLNEKKIHAYVVIIHEISNIEEFFSTWQEGEAIPQISLEC